MPARPCSPIFSSSERKIVGVSNISKPLVLAVEILSPATRRKDLLLKRSKYEDAGVPSYWVVDPVQPSFTAHELTGGRYRTAAQAAGGRVAHVQQPFPVQVTPAELVTQQPS